MLTPWKYKAGVEMTFQRNCKTDRSFQKWSESAFWGDGLCRDKITLRNSIPSELVVRVEHDPDCIEAPTKVLKSWVDAKETISTILDCAAAKKFIAKNKGFSTGGGGHVHVSGMDNLTKCAALRDMQNRPYVPWFFADPDTTTQCNSVQTTPSPFYWRDQAYAALLDPWSKIVKGAKKYNWSWKYAHTRIHPSGTFEFRFFDCFMEYERYEESLAFAQAYMQWIAGLVRKGKKFDVSIIKRSDLLDKYDDYARCLEEFQELVETVGLPWDRYKKYISNLDQRFEDVELLR